MRKHERKNRGQTGPEKGDSEQFLEGQKLLTVFSGPV